MGVESGKLGESGRVQGCPRRQLNHLRCEFESIYLRSGIMLLQIFLNLVCISLEHLTRVASRSTRKANIFADINQNI